MEEESSSCFFINGNLPIDQYLTGTWMSLLMLSSLAGDLEFKNLLLTSIGHASMYSQEDSTLALGKALDFSKSPTVGYLWMAWWVEFSFSKLGPCTSGAFWKFTTPPLHATTSSLPLGSWIFKASSTSRTFKDSWVSTISRTFKDSWGVASIVSTISRTFKDSWVVSSNGVRNRICNSSPNSN